MGDIVAFLFGLCCGSFLNVCIYRIPRGQSLIHPSSYCPHCKHPISPLENIPILSYLLLKGRCKWCKVKISLRYPIVELLTGGLYVMLWQRYGLSPMQLVYIPLCSVFIVIAFIDLEHYLIPDRLTYPFILLGLLVSLLRGGITPANSIAGMLVGGGFIYLLVVVSPYLFGKEGMGLGDVKLVALIGTYLGWKMTIIGLFISSVLGSIVGICLILLKKKGRRDYIPFGPYLVMGAVVMLLMGEKILQEIQRFISIL